MLLFIIYLGVFATCITWFPTTGKQTPDTFAISCTDGLVYKLNFI